MTTTIPRDLTLTVRRGPVVSPSKAADLRVEGDAATLVYDRHRANPGTAVWLARVLLSQHGYAVRETILDGMGPDITVLFREASRLRLNVELGSRIAVPTVVARPHSPASYLIPAGWDLADAVDRLPAAHAAARPEVVGALARIAEEKRDHGGALDRAFDTAAGMILETGDPAAVWDTLTRVLDQVEFERAGARG
ncbi:hypothetical protein [Streptomyces sp. T028]|uniref:hypothetical protein n=1 Tax=Streptomyces sp. T028 TaxID=3394379 RepID=UPI003A897787